MSLLPKSNNFSELGNRNTRYCNLEKGFTSRYITRTAGAEMHRPKPFLMDFTGINTCRPLGLTATKISKKF